MQAQRGSPNYARLNASRGSKRQLLGNTAAHVAPAWRTNGHVPNTITGPFGKGKGTEGEQGSKIFLSRLPVDVGEKEVEDLFKKTVGPLRESFLVYNSQGKSKGMAIVVFQRPGDAAIARAKYDGKIVDGRRPIQIELISDKTPTPNARAQPQTPSLLNRLGGIAPANHGASTSKAGAFQPLNVTPAVRPSVTVQPIPPRRMRVKKGAKRLKKIVNKPKTKEQLDNEMEDYRAAAPIF